MKKYQLGDFIFQHRETADRKALEKFLGFELKRGLNTVGYELNSNNFNSLSKGLKLTVSFDVLVPIDNDNFCVIKEVFNVEGRGAKTHLKGALERMEEILIENEIVYSYPQEEFLFYKPGTEKIKHFVDVNEATFESRYVSVEHIDFYENKVNVVEDVSDMEFSTPGKVTYLKGNKTFNNYNLYMFYDGAVYIKVTDEYKNTPWTVILYTSYRGNEGNVLITNLGKYIKVKDIEAITNTELTFEEAEYDTKLIVYGSKALWEVYNIGEYDYNGNLYYTTENGEFELFAEKTLEHFSFGIMQDESVVFNTTIRSKKLYLDSGRYIKASLNIDGDTAKYILAPVNIYFLNDSQFNNFTAYMFRGKLYGIVGSYEKIGFIIDRNSQYQIYIGEIPDGDHIPFFQTYKELCEYIDSRRNRFSNKDIVFNCYDKKFTKDLFDYEVGDNVEVIDEITEQSNIKGLQGTVIEISQNKQKLKLKFFGYFEETLDIYNVKKLNKKEAK